jgi:Cu2+-exporting ATPase
MIQQWFGYRAPVFWGSELIPPALGTIIFFYGGIVFLKGAAKEIKARLPGMMSLISLAISVAFFFSLAVTLGYEGMDLWWELATLVTIMLLGHWIEMKSVMQASGALRALAGLLPDKALRITNGATEQVPVNMLSDGDVLLIRPGANVPADGLVIAGDSSVDEALVTGESKPISKKRGDKVIAGSFNAQGSLRVKVTGTGERTTLAGIMRLVQEAQISRSKNQDLADKAAFFLTVIAISAAFITAAAWAGLGESLNFIVSRVVTVLVIACPHALGLAIPLVVAVSTTLAAKNGLLVRRRKGLEEARRVNTVVFDKTGTLTLGEQKVVETITAAAISKKEVLALAASVEHDSEHPIARAILKSASETGVNPAATKAFKAYPGKGVEAIVEGKRMLVGSSAILQIFNVEISQEFQREAKRIGNNGQAAIYLADNEKVLALFAIADAIRDSSYLAVKNLQNAGIEVAMLTGDSLKVAEAVAKELGIHRVYAEVLPEDKSNKIKALQREGKKVAMVGDGINDAPALLTADLGIAIGAGTDVAVEAGDVVLIRSEPLDVARILKLSQASYRKMLQNLWWAAGYNLLAIPLAAGILAAWGIILQPAVGAILMSASTLIVALNAQLMRGLKL